APESRDRPDYSARLGGRLRNCEGPGAVVRSAGLVELVRPDEDRLRVEPELRVVVGARRTDEVRRVERVDVPRAVRIVGRADRHPGARDEVATRREVKSVLELLESDD